MATAAAPGTVWVGFMDVVPVIGTVKEGVEWILAVYENNKEVVMEKEQLIIGSLQPQMKLLEKGMKELKFPETPEASQEEGLKTTETSEASGLEFAGMQSIREMKVNELIEYVRSCSGSEPVKEKMSVKEKKERREKIEKIEKDVRKKLQLLGLDEGLAQGLDEEVRRSNRGEHVFNCDILKFHSKVLKVFKDHNRIEFPTWCEHVREDNLDKHTLSQRAEEEIMYRMKVRFKDTEFYVNANAVLYGRYSQELGKALHEVLKCVYPEIVSEEKREKVNEIIDLMNRYEIYVDHLAKEKWTSGGRRWMDRFNRVKTEVVKMYLEERECGWCIKILERLRSWFETPH